MGSGRLTIDLSALVENWRALDAISASGVETGAVIKADSYGLGAETTGPVLAKAGVRTFFVATAEEGAILRKAIGDGPVINVFSGHMESDTTLLTDATLVPMLNSVEQAARQFERSPGHPFGIQLDSGMNRLGMEAGEWSDVRTLIDGFSPTLVMSHLACADEPDHPMNRHQLDEFIAMTQGYDAPKSLAATGGVLLGADNHFDMTRPGVGLYGGFPFEDARPVVRLELPVIQVRDVDTGETVGYSNTWTAKRPSRVATVASGYADGILRAISDKAALYVGATPCPLIGRVSMDLITVDVTDLDETPAALTLLGPEQGVDALADIAGTIGYEILTSLGHRYQRQYEGGA